MVTEARADGEILLAQPRGFCAGVDRAITIVQKALEKFGAPIYVRHEIVHNAYVVNDLRAKGAIFVDELSEVPAGATVIFSAHGVAWCAVFAALFGSPERSALRRNCLVKSAKIFRFVSRIGFPSQLLFRPTPFVVAPAATPPLLVRANCSTACRNTSPRWR